MDKNYFIDEYLKGKHPIEQEKWELPADNELDRDEALYDALLAERPSKSPLKGDFTSPLRGGRAGSWGRFGGGLLATAAVLVAVVALFTWRSFTPQKPTQLAETETPTITPRNAAGSIGKRSTRETPTQHAGNADAARGKRRRSTLHFGSPQVAHNKPITKDAQISPEPTPTEPKLTDAADSLYYYLTQLENQMGDCQDSTCLAELTGLIRADERIKDLVNKIIHRQVETAYQEEYLVDTTILYIPI